MKVYLAGPMRGIPYFNFPAFTHGATTLRTLGHIVFNPAERDEQIYGRAVSDNATGNVAEAEAKGFSLRDALATDLAWICRKADAVALLPGWESSRGAQAEKAVAEALGLKILYL